jgi:hypothetical protein
VAVGDWVAVGDEFPPQADNIKIVAIASISKRISLLRK